MGGVIASAASAGADLAAGAAWRRREPPPVAAPRRRHRRHRRRLTERDRDSEQAPLPIDRANASSKLTCLGTEGKKPAMRIIPLASICGSTVSCGSITATPTGRDCRGGGRRKSPPAAPPYWPGSRGAEIAQHGVIAGLVGLVEGEQRGAHQDQHPVAVDLRRLGLSACAAPAAVTAATINRRSTVRPALVLVTTLRSPLQAHHAKVAPTRLPTPWC